MGETKIDTSLPPIGSNTNSYWENEENSKHVAINPAALLPQDSLVNGNILDSSNLDLDIESVTENVSSSKPSYVLELLKKAWSLVASEPKKEESQFSEEQRDKSIQASYSRPLLAKPETKNDAEMNDFFALFNNDETIQPVNNSNNSENNDLNSNQKNFSDIGEGEIEKVIYDVHKKQAKIRQTASINLKDSILQDAEERKRLWTQYLDLKKEAERREKYSKVFNWLTIGTGVIAGSLLVGGIVAAVVGTGGMAAVPAALLLATSLAGIVGGCTGISGSVFSFLGNKSQGNAFVVKEKSNLKKDEIMAKLQSIEQSERSS